MARRINSKTYKLFDRKKIENPFDPYSYVVVHRIQAKADIPEHGVKKGDIGGYIGKEVGLEETTAWVEIDAIVLGSVYLGKNVLIGGKAKVCGYKTGIWRDEDTKIYALGIKNNVTITDNATVDCSGNAKFIFVGCSEKAGDTEDNVSIKGDSYLKDIGEIIGNVHISDDVSVGSGVSIKGDITISDKAFLESGVSIQGVVDISDSVVVGTKSKISGHTKITGEHKIPPRSVIHDGTSIIKVEPKREVILKEYKAGAVKTITNELSGSSTLPPTKDKESSKNGNEGSTIIKESVEYSQFVSIKDAIESYEKDIVKLLKYPLMVDLTNEYTASMVFALKKAEACLRQDSSKKFSKAVDKLEQAFLVAESHARKVASTQLTDEERKKAQRAKDLFAIAVNESSSETEKVNAFKQGFRNLEGVVPVSDSAVEQFRNRIGLPELEASLF